MSKRIVVCADGTWNRPEVDLKKDHPTNVLRLARAIDPGAAGAQTQQVFYDWGVGSYHNALIAGVTGNGLEKNVMDDYRYIVQNYEPGDAIYLFGFSRGAYTVRSLCGLINNCGILLRPDAQLIQAAFNLYKKAGARYKPDGSASVLFRERHAHPSREVHFVGVWDTVGALGIPITFLGLLEPKDEFYDTKLGRNVNIARHALAVDERRSDFEPTVWRPREGLDLKQMWFPGSHGDVGGGYRPDRSGGSLSDISLQWMIGEAQSAGLRIEDHLVESLRPDPLAKIHQSRKHIYRTRPAVWRDIDHGRGEVLLHPSLRERWQRAPGYRPRNLREFVENRGW